MNSINIYKRIVLNKLKEYEMEEEDSKLIYCSLFKNKDFILNITNNNYDKNIDYIEDILLESITKCLELKQDNDTLSFFKAVSYYIRSNKSYDKRNIDKVVTITNKTKTETADTNIFDTFEDVDIMKAIDIIDNSMTEEQKKIVNNVLDMMRANQKKYNRFFNSSKQKELAITKLIKYNINFDNLQSYLLA